MSEAIDTIRSHFNQRPIPKAKCLLDERNRVNAMIDAIEDENKKLQNQIDYLMDSEHLEAVATSTMGCDECGRYKIDLFDANTENVQLRNENKNLRALATHALRCLIDMCDIGANDLCIGKPCEQCTNYGSSDCPRLMTEVYGVTGIKVD